jgi:hypothetical protein
MSGDMAPVGARLVASLSFVCRSVWAYLDAGTGAYVIQLVIAGFLGGLFAIKLFWKKIGAFLRRVFTRKPSNEQPPE